MESEVKSLLTLSRQLKARIAELEAERDALKSRIVILECEDAKREALLVATDKAADARDRENALLRNALEQIAGPDGLSTVPEEYRAYWRDRIRNSPMEIARAALARIPEAKPNE